jgi:hypothetical protein
MIAKKKSSDVIQELSPSLPIKRHQCQNRKMTSSKNKESSIKTLVKKDSSETNKWYLTVFAVVIAVTIATRFHKVNEPDHVW